MFKASPPESVDNFSRKRRDAMKAIRFGNQKDLVLKTMPDRLAFHEKRAFTIELEIRKNAKVWNTVKLLIGIPGINY